MNITSFSKMKCYRKNGRISVILKLRLPCDSDLLNRHPDFNSFYEQLSEQYLLLLEKAYLNVESGARPAVVKVDYRVITDEFFANHPKLAKRYPRLTAVRRNTLISINGSSGEKECVDLYDEESRLFIK